MFKMGRKKNNMNTPLMMTIVGLGVGAAAYMMRGRTNTDNQATDSMMDAAQKAMNQLRD
ncbi:hypothetical protein H1D32_12940 [Anaerobacillus sp. CMMVII]|uniref:hypothetical protein n=1 Tax=Anaerobacillus sp. CMMVII TaxID=2755588 RepID=UPI0021B82F33|nr:hypothetical protein [Anaerobacillus sp. CMMVII]MCT8138568.1 hypothetical protein [Anaerobacillus sp. CMMVII]